MNPLLSSILAKSVTCTLVLAALQPAPDATSPSLPAQSAPPSSQVVPAAPAPAVPTPSGPASPTAAPETSEAVLGQPAPPTAPGSSKARVHVTPGLEVFAHYMLRSTREGEDTRLFHSFDVPRVLASMDGTYDAVRARLVLEGVRSTGEGSLLGVAGDSVLLRLREAFASYTFSLPVTVALGVVPTLTIPELDGTYTLRVVAPSTLEASGLASPADLGATIRFRLPAKLGWVGVGAFNGEGYARRELNRGKTGEAALELHPLASVGVEALALFASGSVGSTGVDAARADRISGGVLWQGIKLRAGAIMTYAMGFGADGTKDTIALDSFVRVDPYGPLVLGARVASFWRNAATSDAITSYTLSAGVKVAAPLEVHFIGSRSMASTLARAAMPGTDFWEARIATRVWF